MQAIGILFPFIHNDLLLAIHTLGPDAVAVLAHMLDVLGLRPLKDVHIHVRLRVDKPWRIRVRIKV